MIRISEVAERYSSAFFQVVQSEGLLDKVADDFLRLDRMLTSKTGELTQVLANPVIRKRELENFLEALSKKMSLQPLTANLLRLMARRRRTKVLHQVILHFSQLLKEERGESTVDVITHKTIDEKQSNSLKKALKSKTGREITLHTKIDKSLLGGIVIRYESYVLDYSLRHKLSELKHQLEGLS